ncbi:hypothetical protein ACI6Q2_18135 [Chitinophagaceae bacterium LWZ2-11]
MKRLSAGILLFAVIAMFSCTKTVEGPKQTYTVDQFTIRSQDWQMTNNGYIANISFPEITPDIVDYGGVVVYISFDQGGSFYSIPDVYRNVSYSVFHTVGNLTILQSPPTGEGIVSNPGGI